MAATACGQEPERQPVPEKPNALATGFLGDVTYRYDPALLTSANVQIAIPPAQAEEAYAIKLVPVRSVEQLGETCPANVDDCALESQPGVTLALLERPFEKYEATLRSSELADEMSPTTVAGTTGILISGGTEGDLEVEYRLVPVDNRALLIKLQRDGESTPEKEAIEAVVETLQVGD